MQIKEFKEKEVDVKDKSLSNKVYFAVGGIVLAALRSVRWETTTIFSPNGANLRSIIKNSKRLLRIVVLIHSSELTGTLIERF